MQDEVVAIKRELIGLMISVPSGIQSQLGDAISVIADSDFWQRWDTLIDVCGLKEEKTQTSADISSGPGSKVKAR